MRHKLLLCSVAVCTAALAIFLQIDRHLQPILQETAEYECRAITVRAMNQVVLQDMEEFPELYRQLYTITTHSDGTIAAVEFNSVSINLVRLRLSHLVDEALTALPDHEIHLPLGSLINSALLNNVGPNWILTLHPLGYVDATIEEEMESVPVHQVRYRVTLTLRVTINMLLDGNHSTAVVEHQIPLSSLLISGDVPTYYGPEL